MLKEIDSLSTPLEKEESLIRLEDLDGVLSKMTYSLPESSNALDDNQVFLDFLDEVLKRNPEFSFSKKVEMLTKMLSNQESETFGIKRIIDFVKEKINTTEFVFAFIKKSKDKYEEIIKETSSPELKRLERNKYLNYLRIVGILPSEEYDNIHREGLYNFSDRQNPNAFAEQIQSYVVNGVTGIMQEKNIVSLGAGACSDELSFLENGAKEVKVIDSSGFVLDKVRKKIIEYPEKIQKKLVLPDEPEDMFLALKKMKERGEKTEVFYSHSSLHFYDLDKFKMLLSLMKDCLVPNGNLIFAVKAPGAMMDGNGICIVNQESKNIAYPDEDIDMDGINESTIKVVNRGWLNQDGILRFYRDMDIIEKILKESGFFIKRTTKDVLENREGNEIDQTAYYFICQLK